MKRVLVTGATGFIGVALAQRLTALGRVPRLMVRRPHRGALLASLGAELVHGDLRSVPSLRRAVRDVDTVFHLGARAAFEPYDVLRPTLVDGTRALAEASAEAGVRCFVFSSSVLVYGSHRGIVDERTPVAPETGYGRAKVDAERALARVAQESDMRLCILRLGHVYGARSLLFRHAQQGWVPFAGGGDNAFCHLHVDDAARAMMAVAERGWSGVSPLADERPATFNEFLAVLREHFPHFRVLRVPAPIARIGAGLLRPWQRLRRSPSLWTPDAVRGWQQSLPVAPGLVWKDIGLRPSHPTIHEGIPAALDDCVAFRWRHPLLDRSHA